MNELLAGVDFEGLAPHGPPQLVPGRTLHIDGDFIAYFCTYNELQDWDTARESAHIQIKELRDAAGAEFVHIHMTKAGGDKGGRYERALQREYQGNRRVLKPSRLDQMREYLARTFPASMWSDQEADDGLAQALWKSHCDGTPHLAVLVSRDKDLNQVQGLHLDWGSRTLYEVRGFGSISIDFEGKLVGTGNAFFWAQMLMGDTADNIQGCPKIAGEIRNRFDPTKAILKAQKVLAESKVEKDIQKAKKVISERKSRTCGSALAYKILADVTDNETAFHRVAECYRHGGPYFNYRYGERVPWYEVMFSEAELLWIRRTHDPNDVYNWWRETYEPDALTYAAT